VTALRSRLGALERSGSSRMIIAKLPASGDVEALLRSSGIDLRLSDMLVRITRPDGCGADFVRVL
jgi:hypothetical protein